METTITVMECEYIGSTVNGNSRYRITDQTGKSYRTKADANFAHGIVSGRRKGTHKPLKDLRDLMRDLWADLQSIAATDIVRRTHKH